MTYTIIVSLLPFFCFSLAAMDKQLELMLKHPISDYALDYLASRPQKTIFQPRSLIECSFLTVLAHLPAKLTSLPPELQQKCKFWYIQHHLDTYHSKVPPLALTLERAPEKPNWQVTTNNKYLIAYNQQTIAVYKIEEHIDQKKHLPLHHSVQGTFKCVTKDGRALLFERNGKRMILGLTKKIEAPLRADFNEMSDALEIKSDKTVTVHKARYLFPHHPKKRDYPRFQENSNFFNIGERNLEGFPAILANRMGNDFPAQKLYEIFFKLNDPKPSEDLDEIFSRLDPETRELLVVSRGMTDSISNNGTRVLFGCGWRPYLALVNLSAAQPDCSILKFSECLNITNATLSADGKYALILANQPTDEYNYFLNGNAKMLAKCKSSRSNIPIKVFLVDLDKQKALLLKDLGSELVGCIGFTNLGSIFLCTATGPCYYYSIKNLMQLPFATLVAKQQASA